MLFGLDWGVGWVLRFLFWGGHFWWRIGRAIYSRGIARVKIGGLETRNVWNWSEYKVGFLHVRICHLNGEMS